MHSSSTRVKAPELGGATDWLNVSQPLALSMLKGKIVVLDFWTFCCVDCMHILPYLKELEHKYADVLVVIGVHSAKFPNEKDSSQIRKAIARYGIEHPVANDSRFAVWEAYWVREWPTLVLIDPDGNIVEQIPCSQRPHGKLDAGIAALVDEFEQSGRLNRQPLPFTQGPNSEPLRATENSAAGGQSIKQQFLSYPGKITADNESIYISDTGNNRIVVADLDGQVKHIIGEGKPGSSDGSYTEAQFHSPQGLALGEDGKLYVADTENHLLRCIDLAARSVHTIAGTGQQALLTGKQPSGGDALKTDLSSPWDLIWHNKRLYICMAGPHQIWYYDPVANRLEIFAGNAVESLKDGPLAHANLAQPSGITTDGKRLYFADAETSAIRAADLSGDNRSITTLIGKGLFEFGDEDGEPSKAKLQHPLGVIWLADKLYICDSYNHKIKIVDPQNGNVATLAGGGGPGHSDGDNAKFAEPGGLTAAGGLLYIADTNNHSIRIVDPANGQTRTLELLQPKPSLDSLPLPNLFTAAQQQVFSLTANQALTIELNIDIPAGYHINEEAPLLVDAQCKLFAEAKFHKQTEGKIRPRFKLTTSAIAPGTAVLHALVQLYYCGDEADSACRVASFLWTTQVHSKESPGAENTVRLSAPLKIT